MATMFNALAAGCAAALLLLACDEKKTDMPAAPSTGSATASVAPKVEAPPAISPAMSASAAPMASASASADAAPAGATEMTLGDVKATKGKVEDGQKKFRLNLPRIQRKCIFPALKKDAAAIGTGNLKLTIEVDAEGKPKKVTHATEGKVPDDVAACIKSYVEKEIEFGNDAKATLEANLVFGPKKLARPRGGRPRVERALVKSTALQRLALGLAHTLPERRGVG